VEIIMKKTFLLAAASLVALSFSSPSYAADDNKIVAAGKKGVQIVMWGPKKVWQGVTWFGKKITGKK
jgi:hypothetical protein